MSRSYAFDILSSITVSSVLADEPGNFQKKSKGNRKVVWNPGLASSVSPEDSIVLVF